MHCSFPYPVGRIVSFCFLFAVPIFFFTSGYFAYYTNKEIASKKIVLKIKHIFKLLLIAECTYFIFELVKSLFRDNVHVFLQTITVQMFVKSIFLNLPMFNGTLWFLYALLFSYIVLFFVNRFDLYKLCYIVAPIILFLHIIIRIIIKNCEFDWYSAGYFRNFLVYGFPLLIIGHFIRENKNKLIQIKNKTLILVAIIGTPLIFVEYFISRQILDFYVTSLIIAVSIFILCIKNPDENGNKIIAYVGDKLSMYVYIVHMLAIQLVSMSILSLRLNENIIIMWGTPILALLLSILISYCLVKIKLNTKTNR